MADKDKIADEMLTDDELDKVAGGTWDEYEELAKFFPYKSYFNGASAGVFARGKSYKSKEWIKDWLKSNLNIEAEIDTESFWPFCKAGPNTYTRNGESLTHEQVVKEVRAIRG